MLTVNIVWATDETWELEVRTQVAPTYDLAITDTYTAKVSQKSDTPILFAPTVTWRSTSTVNLSVSAAQSAMLNGGETYPLKIYRTRGSITNCIGNISLYCTAAPRS